MKEKPRRVRTRRLVTLALMACVSLIIFAVEAALPPVVPVPGVKPGLANVVTLLLVVLSDRKGALAVLLVRVVLAAVFAGQAISLLYSLCGGLLALIAMCAASALLGGRPVWFISAAGAVFHHAGQLAAACVMMSPTVLVYLPYLMISGVLTGVTTGIITQITMDKARRNGLLGKFTAALDGEERD